MNPRILMVSLWCACRGLAQETPEVAEGVIRVSVTAPQSAGYQVKAMSSATKTSTPLLDIPQSIGVVTQELIKDQGMQQMADVVRYIPGITMAQGEGHRDAPVIRGNQSTADLFVDGIRDDAQYFRDLYNVDRVEALKGSNAMMFGRGGGGGVLNRVTKEAVWMPLREVTLQGGSFLNRRVTGDFGQALHPKLAFRLNGLYENSKGFRRYANMERYGVNPTVTYLPNAQTRLRLGYEGFHDGRVVDRGLPSYRGAVLPVDVRTFFGNPDASRAEARVHLGSVAFERQVGRAVVRNQSLFSHYDKVYGNVFPGAVNAAGTEVTLAGYRDAGLRDNGFNQTNVVYALRTGRFRHTLLHGVEFGRQNTSNLRHDAVFAGGAASIRVPLTNPTDFTAVAFSRGTRDNFVNLRVASVYAQDQVEITRHMQVVAGLRYESFHLRYRDHRTANELSRRDGLLSPRLGVVVKPAVAVSLYGNYSVSYLPSAGDQFASLDATSQTLKPEKFSNYEAGVKWDVRPRLSLTAALYRLDRTNTRGVDPNDPSRIVQTGAQRTNGFEFSFNGSPTRDWQLSGGYAYQDAFITARTQAAVVGAQTALVPHHTVSLWNHYHFTSRLGGGLGVIGQAGMFAAVDNAVRLPGFTRVDAAVFYSLTEAARLQANVENLFDRTYYPTAHSNSNILPGSLRAVRVAMTVRF
jgi:catecholate siderophore receptor